MQVATWPSSDINVPIYNTRDFVQPEGESFGHGPFADVLRGARPLQVPRQPLPESELQVGEALPAAMSPPYPGARQVLTFRTRIILSAGNDQRHALSNKVECTLQLAELAREVGLSDAGVAYIAALCGPRRVVTAHVAS